MEGEGSGGRGDSEQVVLSNLPQDEQCFLPEGVPQWLKNTTIVARKKKKTWQKRKPRKVTEIVQTEQQLGNGEKAEAVG